MHRLKNVKLSLTGTIRYREKANEKESVFVSQKVHNLKLPIKFGIGLKILPLYRHGKIKKTENSALLLI